jgi:hypothetical protein
MRMAVDWPVKFKDLGGSADLYRMAAPDELQSTDTFVASRAQFKLEQAAKYQI